MLLNIQAQKAYQCIRPALFFLCESPVDSCFCRLSSSTEASTSCLKESRHRAKPANFSVIYSNSQKHLVWSEDCCHLSSLYFSAVWSYLVATLTPVASRRRSSTPSVFCCQVFLVLQLIEPLTATRSLYYCMFIMLFYSSFE